MNKAVVALGSNINPRENTDAALEAIAEAFSLLATSRFVFTKPVGYKNQPDFLNGAALIETTLQETEITSELKKIEKELGRIRNGHKNGPRKIDLDLVLFNGRVLDGDVFERDFLRRSIREILPGVKLAD